MARLLRSSDLDSRNARRRLPVQHEPHWMKLAPRQFFGYFKPSKGAGSWRARIYFPEDGVKRKTTLGTADDYADANGTTILSFAQAQALAQKWLQETAEDAVEFAGEGMPSADFTVAMALDDYLKAIRQAGQKSVAIAEQVINARIKPTIGDVPLAKLTQRKIRDWLDEQAGSPRLKTGRKRKEGEDPEHLEAPATDDARRARKVTANRVFAILKRALNLALENGRIRNGRAWQAVKPFRGVIKARVRFLSPEDQVRLVNVCPPDFRRLVQAALLTGARYGELVRLLVRDFEAKAGTVFIPAQIAKAGKERHIILTKEGQEFFAEQTAGRPGDEVLFTRASVIRTKRAHLGMSWGPTEQGPMLAAACEAAKLDPITFHELRHTYASTLVNRGVPLAYVAAQLGHSDTRMVERHYGHLAPSEMAKAIRKLVPTLGITKPAKVKPLKLKRA